MPTSKHVFLQMVILDASGKGVRTTGSAAYGTDRHGTPNACVYFDGNSHFIIDTLGKILPTNEWTICFWSKTTQINNNIHSLPYPIMQAIAIAIPIHYSAGSPSRLIFDYGDIEGTGRNLMNMSFDTMWHHYAFINTARPDQKNKCTLMDIST
jgi:hypothetical protein